MDYIETVRKLLNENGITEIFGYSRKSREVDEETLKKHHDIIDALAVRIGFPITIYEEVDSSEHLNRTKLNLLRSDIKKRKVRCLVVYRIDRLSRKVTDTERLLKEFAFNDLILIEAHKEKVVDYKEYMGIKLEAMMSDLYLEQAKMVLHAGRQQSVKLYGNHLGEAPLGFFYDKETKKLAPNNDAWIVKKVFDLCIEGFSTYAIAIKLNQMGIRTRKLSEFGSKTVWGMLKNEKYVGKQVYGKTEWMKDGEGKKLSKPRNESEWITYENAHESIIDHDVFDQVQELLLKGNRTGVGKKLLQATFTLSKVVKCAKCGSTMHPTNVHYKSKDVVKIRACSHIDFLTGERCPNNSANAELIEESIKEILWNEVRPIFLNVKRLLAKDRKVFNVSNDKSQLRELQKQKAQLIKQIDNLIDMQIDVGKSDRLVIKLKQLEVQLEMVEIQINDFQESTIDDPLLWVEHYLNESQDLISLPIAWMGLDSTMKNGLIRKYVSTVVVDDGVITSVEFNTEIQKILKLNVKLDVAN